MDGSRSLFHRSRGAEHRDGVSPSGPAGGVVSPARTDARSARRSSGSQSAQHTSSIDLLTDLAQEPSVQELLAEFGVHARTLLELRGELRRSLDPEPADWRVRLAQRGAGKLGVSEFDRLLAIARSADCHAYQLLERAGVPCGQLRKRLIERLRERGTASIHRAGQAGSRTNRK